MWLCDGRLERQSLHHQMILNEKQNHIMSMNNTMWLLLEEKEARRNETSSHQDALLQKLQASESRLFHEWVVFKLSLVIFVVVLLFVVSAAIRLWNSLDRDMRHLQAQVAKYEGTLQEKERHIQKLLEITKAKKPTEQAAFQTAATTPFSAPSPSHHFVYALPGLPTPTK